MCLSQGPQPSDAGESSTLPLSDCTPYSNFKITAFIILSPSLVESAVEFIGKDFKGGTVKFIFNPYKLSILL